ncbi:TPA: thermosome subunit [Candidatus Woesearchaeota archaeon]|nr:thermosome subunit [Candidatus Woesearchaeota archaeon]
MNNSNNVQPIFILPQDTKRTVGREAQRMNIAAAKLVAETVRTTLGPKGMDKMIVDAMGDVIVTNDGVTILKEMQIEHPSAKMIVEIAKTQEHEVGDGTTTAVVLAGELLKNAEALLDRDIHPTIIARGYRLAAEQAQAVLASLAKPVTLKDRDMLRKIAMTAMTGKGAEADKEHLASLIVTAIEIVVAENATNNVAIGSAVAHTDKTKKHADNRVSVVDRSAVSIEVKSGGTVEETELISGILLDKEKISSTMPQHVDAAKIALLDCAVEIKNTEIDAKISITDPKHMQAFLDMEEQMLRKMTERIIQSGATVLFCQKGIDDLAQHFLSKAGIYACRRVKKSDMERIGKATGARIVSNIDDLSAKDLGNAGLVEESRVGEEMMTFIRECPHAKAVTILVRGSTEHVIAEIKRALEDAVGDIAAALANGKVVAGAGSIEVEVARHLHAYANKLSGREQLAVRAFADTLEVIPRTLAENAGLDPIDAMTDLKAAHDKGQEWAGIDVFTGKTFDAWEAGVIEPLRIKTQAIASASEVAVMILRIDDVIAGGKAPDAGNPPGGPQGMHSPHADY